MTKLTICDCCQKPCTAPHFQLSGLWHLVTESKKSRIPQRLGKEVKADLCQTCSDDVGLKFNPEMTREGRLDQWKKENPGSSVLKGLRKTVIASLYIEDVFCDLCQKICSDEYARIESTWLTESKEKLYADLCPDCLKLIRVEA